MKILFVLVVMFSYLMSAKGQKLHFESKASINADTLKVAEQKNGDLILKLILKATDTEKPLSIQIFTEDHVAATKGYDYLVDFPDTLRITLNNTNSFSTSFNLTILSNSFDETIEHFRIYCRYKNSKGKDTLKMITVEISKPGNDMNTANPIAIEIQTIKEPAKRQVVYSNGITCDEGKLLELTLTALEGSKNIEELEITWSSRDKEDKKDTFNLAGNKTHFGNKASTLAKQILEEVCTDSEFRANLDTAYDVAIYKIKEIEKNSTDNKEEIRLNKIKDSIINIVNKAIDVVAEENEDAAIIELKSNLLNLYKGVIGK